MKDKYTIWFDITNSPHVIIFEELIKELQKKHNVVITTRNLANTIDLLKLKNIEYVEIGGHAGAGLFHKLWSFPKRVISLYKFLNDIKIDIAISQSSFYSPITAWLLRKPSIYMNDNEHAKGNWISFLFATKTLIPEFLEKLSKKQKWHWLTKIVFYNGTKECIYLKNIKKKDMNIKNKKDIYVRPEPWTAQYYKGKKFFLDNTILNLSKDYTVHLLPRGEAQAKHYKQSKFNKIIIEEKAISLEDIINNCDLFIGAGGTMTREIAIMGIPTISIYQDKLLEVDNFLISNGFMVHKKELNIKFINDFINTANKSNNKILLKKGQEAYNLIKKTIFEII